MIPAPRFRQVPTTSTVTTRPTGRPVISARSITTQRQQQMTAESAKDPEQVARAVNALQQDVAQSTVSLRNEPESGAIIFVGIAVAGGTALVLTHNFGRPFRGYRVTRTYVGASQPIQLQDAALPAGLSFLNVVSLMPTGTGTADIRVW